MRINEKIKKSLSGLLCLCMLAQNAPVTFAAQEDCTHHVEHTAECGYAAAVEGSDCTHSHDADCGYAEAVEEVLCACAETDENGALVHAEGCSYVAPVAGSDCTHSHDGSCGYAAAAEAHECRYECAECAVEEEEQETTAPSEPETTEAAEVTEAAEPIELHQTVTRALELDAVDFDNDEAFAAYVERLFYGDSGVSTFAPLAGDRLEGTEKVIYDGLKPHAAAIAAGTQPVAPFIISSADLGVNVTLTEAEMGKPILVENDGALSFTAEAQTELVNRFFAQVKIQKALYALLSDCPYDLYWFDKANANILCNMGAAPDENGELYGMVTDLVLTLPVAKDYQDPETGAMKTDKIEAAAAAAETAKGIAAANQGKTDYEKLVAYKNYICDAVSYNFDAVSPEYTGGYGDPYQMVYVFDGDSTTNVVCEGYSKAFQYLCEQSGIDCISVAGPFGSENENGPHMWNIAILEGKNYLVDVTNSDEGSCGQYGGLFLAGNATGSVADGYSFYVGVGDKSGTVKYEYDPAFCAIWDTENLTLAKEDFIVKPANLTATYGDTLADVTLPDGFTWQDEETTSVGDAGTNVFKVICTRGEGDHREVLKDILVVVTVEKATAEAKTMPAQKYFHTYENVTSMDLTEYLPEDRGTTTCTLDTITGDFFAAGTAVTNEILSYTTKVMDAVASGSITVKVVMKNYTDMTLTVPVELVAITADAQQRIDQKNLTQVPAGLADSSLDTVDKIEEEQCHVLADLLGHDPQTNIAHYDVKLQYAPDGSSNWVNVTPEDFPADGLTVTLPYPEGTGKDTHKFVVSHMFTTGSKAGTTETPDVENTAEGIRFKVTGLSPVSVAWDVVLYDVNIAAATNGTVSVSAAHTTAGTQVTITATPYSGYRLSTLTVQDANGNYCTLGAVNDNAYIFCMPTADVTVRATFVRNSTAAADPTNPKAGDDFCIFFWAGMMLTSLLGIAAVLLNRKKLLCLLTVCLLLAVMPVRVSADTDVAAMLEQLPTVEQFQAMDADAQLEAYNRTQAAYDAYMALSEEEKAGMENAEETFETLFGYFNTLVAPAEEPAETASSNDTASNLLSTAIAAVVGILLAQKLITKRKIG